MFRPLLVLVLLFGTGLSSAGSVSAAPGGGQVIQAPPAGWVLPHPAGTDAATPPEAPLRVIYDDRQVRIGPAGEEVYSAWRILILKPEALPVGNVSLVWSPTGGTATVHHLRIIRDGAAIDVLKGQSFQVIQREGGLEQAMLDGRLTAMLQVPGLRVGDELEFAATILQRDATLGDHGFGMMQMATQGMPGVIRFRLNWPDATKLAWRATRDLPQAVPLRADGQTSIEYQLRDPSGVILNDGAPPRYNIRRLIEYSDFARWADISSRFAPLFDDAAKLAPTSPVHAEVARIASASSDPVERAQAALRLVQDQVRYVYVGLDGGNYRPVAADDTWQRRFGDCKAKTALLLALLRALKIDAEPVLVNASGDDGMDALLPSPAVFNHVLIRAKIGGKPIWLDGTRLGDRFLDMLPAPGFRWALALGTAGHELEAVAPTPFDRPQLIEVLDIDASAGFGKPASVKAQNIIRADDAYAIRTQLASMSAQDADRAVRGYWNREIDWVEAGQVGWRYDERQATLVLSLTGEGMADWDGDATSGRALTIAGAGFRPPAMRRRPKEQDASLPWTTGFPSYRCYATSIRLPAGGAGWRWTYYAEPVDLVLGATTYWRAAGLNGNVMRTVTSNHIDKPEISAAEAKAVNDAIPDFNNDMSRVYQQKVAGRKTVGGDEVAPFADGIDWSADAAACSAPTGK